jgi:hypothetical protein
MKRILKRTVFLFVVVAILSPFQGQAFNPATHVYITAKVAKQVFPFTFDKTNLYYGSIAPDISSYADPADWPNGFCETHYRFTKLPYAWWNPIQKAFAQGWQIHNERWPWGADYYAHGTCTYSGSCPEGACKYDGYVPEQAALLAKEFSLDENLAHFAIEVAIDVLLIDNKDRTLGQKLLSAALFRSPGDMDLLASVHDIGVGLAALTSAESTFRNLVINYATALTLPEPLRMGLLGEIGVQVANGMGAPGIDSATVQLILEAAINQCRLTYYAPVGAAIEGIIKYKSNLIK